jgi:uncharacterized protein YabN with tetrapyrrole methylase and pyrophosphatase domain
VKGVGFDWENSGDVLEKVKEEISEFEKEFKKKTILKWKQNSVTYCLLSLTMHVLIISILKML